MGRPEIVWLTLPLPAASVGTSLNVSEPEQPGRLQVQEIVPSSVLFGANPATDAANVNEVVEPMLIELGSIDSVAGPVVSPWQWVG